MQLKSTFIIISALLPSLLLSPAASAQPKIELPPPDQPRQAIPRPPLLQLQRESQIEVPLYEPPPTNSSTAIGGYGELTLNAPSNGPNVVDMRRIVLYIGHNFTEKLRFYGELELEHAVTSADDAGEFELEQAFLDYLAWRPLNFRAGVILVPMGIINIYHEPPTFNGVDRPETDTVIIPSTWREPGAGVFGDIRGLRYQAYVVNGFKANGFTASNGVREGHQEAAARLRPRLGPHRARRLRPALPLQVRHQRRRRRLLLLRARRSGSADVQRLRGRHGPGDHARSRPAPAHARPRIPRRGRQRLDRRHPPPQPRARRRRRGRHDRVRRPGRAPAPRRLRRARLQRLPPAQAALRPIARARSSATSTPTRSTSLPSDLARAPGNNHDIITAGLTFRPIAEVAVKFDYQRVWTDAVESINQNVDRFNLGLAFMF